MTMLAANMADAEKTRRRVTTADGLETGVSVYFGVTAADGGTPNPGLGALFPVAYRIDQDPGTQADPHFHQANQFQVFVGGAGYFGKQAVRPVMAQYAQAFTPYGPIVAGPQGLSYFTLRNGWDPGGQFMPAQRELLKASGRSPRAELSTTMELPRSSAELKALAEPTHEVTLALAGDGLGGWRYRLPPGRSLTGSTPADGGGQYWIVLGGTDTASDVPLSTFACLFLGPDEPARTVTAGAEGLDVLVLQFPRPVARA
jgi:hypothetical protein